MDSELLAEILIVIAIIAVFASLTFRELRDLVDPTRWNWKLFV